MSDTRQQVLFLHCADIDLDSAAVAWAFYDGTAPAEALQDRTGAQDQPPYRSVLAALREGWRLLQTPRPVVVPGRERQTSVIPFEFVLTRDVEVELPCVKR